VVVIVVVAIVSTIVRLLSLRLSKHLKKVKSNLFEKNRPRQSYQMQLVWVSVPQLFHISTMQ
jgi:hypothetical protein